MERIPGEIAMTDSRSKIEELTLILSERSNEPGLVRQSVIELAQNGPITHEVYDRLYLNNYERNYLLEFLDDDAFLKECDNLLKNVTTTYTPTYESTIVHKAFPLICQRFKQFLTDIVDDKKKDEYKPNHLEGMKREQGDLVSELTNSISKRLISRLAWWLRHERNMEYWDKRVNHVYSEWLHEGEPDYDLIKASSFSWILDGCSTNGPTRYPTED